MTSVHGKTLIEGDQSSVMYSSRSTSSGISARVQAGDDRTAGRAGQLDDLETGVGDCLRRAEVKA